MNRAIAERGRYPAMDVLKSISRLMPACHGPHENALISEARKVMAAYADMEELIRIGAYRTGANAEIDRAIALMPQLEAVLAQTKDERSSIGQSFAALAGALQT